MGKHSDVDNDLPGAGTRGIEYSWDCFPKSTLIETPSGKIPIGDLSEGEMVLSYKKGILVPRRITRKLVHEPAPLVNVTFESDDVGMICTLGHSFMTDKGYQSIKKLSPGDSIMRISSSKAAHSCIKSIAPTGTTEPVFNLYTQGEHNFIADGCVAHNFTHFRMLRVVMHDIYDSLCDLKNEGLRLKYL
ncbi:MAG: hypothetical protein K9M10_02220 [Candidatus Pacebacteria bacterium]|nr:hypothetical protein [Candidatus Paceibacterota bacterium]MCF7857276.1 hypothetical protein [Candidatus Paceibacterota bacterium]